MKSKYNISQKAIALSVIVVLIIFVFLPIELPYNISLKAQLYPAQEWLLVKETDGGLMSSIISHQKGINQNYKVAQFDRGDAVEFSINPKIVSGSTVSKEDTIGSIYSNQTEQELIELKANLAAESSLLKVSTSKEKDAVVKDAEQQLEYAKKQLEEQKKMYARQKSLYEKNLISQQEYDISEGAVGLFTINVQIAAERLRTVTTGAKPEEIDLIKTQIDGLNKQIAVLEKKFSQFIIRAPFNGRVKRVFASDTLLIISEIKPLIAFLPVSLDDLNYIEPGQSVEIIDNKTGDEISGILDNIGKTVQTSGGNQYVIATAIFDEYPEQFLFGQIIKGKIICKKMTALNYIKNFFGSMFN